MNLAPGCCSAALPCNFQKDFPDDLCDVCTIVNLRIELKVLTDIKLELIETLKLILQCPSSNTAVDIANILIARLEGTNK